MLSRLEEAGGQLKMAETEHHPAVNQESLGRTITASFQLSEELNGYEGQWDRAGAIKDLKEASEQYALADLTEDPQAPLKALLADTARMTASLQSLDKEQAGRFVKNFMDQSAGVFSDPRAGASFSNNRSPQEMINEPAQKLVAGLDDVSANMVGKKISSHLRQTTTLNAQMNSPRSALERSHNRSFDVERSQKKDPFSHLRGKQVAFEANENSGPSIGPK